MIIKFLKWLWAVTAPKEYVEPVPMPASRPTDWGMVYMEFGPIVLGWIIAASVVAVLMKVLF